MTSAVVILGLVSLVYSLAFVGASRTFALARGMYDRQHDRDGGPAYRPIPRIGGLGVLASLVLSVIVWKGMWSQAGGAGFGVVVVVLGVFVCCVGAVDDVRRVPASVKAAALVGVGVVSFWSGLRIDAVPGLVVEIPWALSLPLTCVWFVAIPTAFNFVDGLDGLAAGLTLIAAVSLAAIGAAQGDATTVLFAVILGATSAGFWYHNKHPARVFMGDSGAMLNGYLVAALATRVLHGGDGGTTVAVAALLAWPATDFTLAIGRRVSRRRPFCPDAEHLHHLLARRLGHADAVKAIHCMAAALAAAGLLATHGPSVTPTVVVLVGLCGTPLLIGRHAHLARFGRLSRSGAFALFIVLFCSWHSEWIPSTASAPTASTPTSIELARGGAQPVILGSVGRAGVAPAEAQLP